MDISRLNNILLFISKTHSIEYTNLLTTLAKYSLLPPQLRSKYTKITKYKSPAVELIAKKYTIETFDFNPKNKMKIIDLKYQIKVFEEEKRRVLEKKYIYLVFIKKLGLSIGVDVVKNCLEK